MKLIPFASLFSRHSRKKPRSDSSDSASSSGDLSPKSVLPAAQSPAGPVTRHELEVVLSRIGPDPPTDSELSLVLASIDELCAVPPESLVGGDLRVAFAALDDDADGHISPEDLLRLFLALGDQACSLQDCRRMIAAVDSDADGLVCFPDFCRMMRAQQG